MVDTIQKVDEGILPSSEFFASSAGLNCILPGGERSASYGYAYANFHHPILRGEDSSTERDQQKKRCLKLKVF